MSGFDKSFWVIITAAVLCGLAAGILGAVFVRVYIWQDVMSDDFNLSNINMNNQGGLVIRDPKNVTVSADVKITETMDSLKPLLLGIFREITDKNQGGYYSLDRPLFTGLIMTADGWAIAPVPEELRAQLNTQDYVAIASDRRMYKIEQIIAADNMPGDFFFLRLTGAANLPVKKAVSRGELKPGKTLLIVKDRQSVWSSNLTTLATKSSLLSSEDFSMTFGLAGLSANDWTNAFVFDLSGSLVAMIAADKEVIPAFSYLPLMASATQSRLTSYPFLGVKYLDLSMVRVPGVNHDKGALIYAPKALEAVIKGSPAETAGLMAGDIIIWVGNRELDAEHSLADVISGYQAGDKIILSYIRDDKESTIEVVLTPLLAAQ